MSPDVERCPQCQQPVTRGASYCLSCGSALHNRSALHSYPAQAPATPSVPGAAQPWPQGPAQTWPQGAAQTPAQGPAQPWSHTPAESRALDTGQPADPHGVPSFTVQDVVRAGTLRRFFAKVIDALIPALLSGSCISIGYAAFLSSGVMEGYEPEPGAVLFLVLMLVAAAVIWLVLVIVLWVWEGRSGSSIGNAIFGVRTTDLEGFAPGAGAIFVRWLVLQAGYLGFGLIVGGLAFFLPEELRIVLGAVASGLGGICFVLVGLSNAWDRNERRQGWHDMAAKTLVFDVRKGRNPVLTSGIAGQYAYPVLDLPALRRVASPAARQAAGEQNPGPVSGHHSYGQGGTIAPGQDMGPAPVQGSAPAAPAQDGFAAPAVAFASPAPAEDAEATRLRAAAPHSQGSFHWAAHDGVTVRIILDDGSVTELGGELLIGRNPAAPGENAALLPVTDPGRSISKTHLQLRVGPGGVWVTDRNSTNGTSVTDPTGAETQLQPGTAHFAPEGSRIRFGDRFLMVGQP